MISIFSVMKSVVNVVPHKYNKTEGWQQGSSKKERHHIHKIVQRNRINEQYLRVSTHSVIAIQTYAKI